VVRELDELDATVRALSVLARCRLGSQDVIAAVGELLSSRIVAAALEETGVPSAGSMRGRSSSPRRTTRRLNRDGERVRAVGHVGPGCTRNAVVLGGFVGHRKA